MPDAKGNGPLGVHEAVPVEPPQTNPEQPRPGGAAMEGIERARHLESASSPSEPQSVADVAGVPAESSRMKPKQLRPDGAATEEEIERARHSESASSPSEPQSVADVAGVPAESSRMKPEQPRPDGAATEEEIERARLSESASSPSEPRSVADVAGVPAESPRTNPEQPRQDGAAVPEGKRAGLFASAASIFGRRSGTDVQPRAAEVVPGDLRDARLLTVNSSIPERPSLVDVIAELGGAHPEYYSQIRFDHEANPPRIDFIRGSGAEGPPPEFRALRRQIEDVARVVRILFEHDRRRRTEFFGQLHVTADSGLRGRNSSVEIGSDNLLDVKNNIADAFPAVRGRIWWWNFALLLGVIAICVTASGFYYHAKGAWAPAVDGASVWPTLQLAVFLIPLGVVVGLFVEFIFRVGDDIPYEQLRAINPGRWRPFQRAFNTIVVAYVFAGILGAGAFQVGVANVLLNDFIGDKPYLSLAIGFVTGFAFPYVRDLVQQFRPAKRDG
jgi:hypothetical protein